MEWTVILTLVTLVTLIATVAKPMLSLNKSITRLAVLMDRFREDMEALTKRNSDSHARLWDHSKKQDDKLENHERRIFGLEVRVKDE